MDDKNTAEKGFKRLQRAIYEIDGLANEGLSLRLHKKTP